MLVDRMEEFIILQPKTFYVPYMPHIPIDLPEAKPQDHVELLHFPILYW